MDVCERRYYRQRIMHLTVISPKCIYGLNDCCSANFGEDANTPYALADASINYNTQVMA